MNEEEIIKNFGFKIKIYRRLRNCSQLDLAKATGLSKPYVSNVENGRHSLSLVNALKFADYFGKDIYDLLSRELEEA